MNKAKYLIVGVVCLLAVASSFWPVGAQKPAGLHVEGVTLRDATGGRFVISGVNQELFRDKGCRWISDIGYQKRDAIADRMSELGINMVRLNYTSSWLMEAGNVAKFVDVIQGLKARGIYSMWAAHEFTGKSISNIETAFAGIGALIDEVRGRGDPELEKFVIAGMVNEPGPDVTPAQWILAAKKSLDFVRTQKSFTGVVAFDGTGWATMIDVPSFRAVMDYDATKLNGTPNVIFANHWYENIGTAKPFQAFDVSNQVPLYIGEIGQANGGADVPKYVTDVLARFFASGMANGHNGVELWIHSWCDTNSLTINWDDAHVKDQIELTTFGKLAKAQLWDKLRGTVPPPQPTLIVSPTRTATRSTPLPTNTLTATRTATVVAPPVQCDATTVTTGTLNGRQAVFTTCIRYN